MTRQEVKWAEQHDWFLSAGGTKIHGVVNMYVQVRDDTQHNAVLIFDSYKKLRAWAGY